MHFVVMTTYACKPNMKAVVIWLALVNSLSLFNMTWIRFLDWILYLSACPLYPPRNKILNFFLYVYGCAIMVMKISEIIERYIHLKVLADELIEVYYYCQISVGNVCHVIVILVIWKNRRNLRGLVKESSRYLTKKDKQNLLRFNIALLLWKVMTHCVKLYYEILTFKQRMAKGRRLYSYTNVWLDTISWDSLVFVLYMLLIRMVHLAEISGMKAMMNKITDNDGNSIILQIRMFISLKDYFMKSVSILPCLSFIYVFFRAVSGVNWLRDVYTFAPKSYLQEYDLQKTLSLVNFALLVFIIVQVIVMSVFTSDQCLESQETLESFRVSVVQTLDLKSHFSVVMDTISEAQRYEFLAWNLFYINKQLLLSFFSSFVTFTMLFVQLIN